MQRSQFHEANRLSWNKAIEARNKLKENDVEFFRAGGTTLIPEQRALLGELSGLSVVHLQCNCGEDTLSLAQIGAIATGVDISDTAIETARRLSLGCGIPATFHRMDVYDWLEQVPPEIPHFDVVFCSAGSVIWLSDLTRWVKGIASVLKPGGRFVLLELHPVLLMFDYDWTLKFPYSSEGNVLIFEEGMDAIVKHPGEHREDVEAFSNPYPSYEFAWGIGEVVMALLEAELTPTTLKEYQYAYSDEGYERIRQTTDGRWLPPLEIPDLPLLYGISALKKGS